MAKRFKLRIPSFHCCRSNDLSTPPSPPSNPDLSSIRHVSSRSHRNDAVSLSPPPPEKKNRRLRNKKSAIRRRFSSSSAETLIFSSDEESETLVSSFKANSSDNSPHKSKKKKNKKKKKKKKRKQEEKDSPARLSVFQRLISCNVEGKIRESFAVVKKSEDPYEDFKSSMMEMVMEKEMFEEKDLEQLLHCLLSLNHSEHHGVIVEAFSEIWRSLFCRTSASRRTSLDSN